MMKDLLEKYFSLIKTFIPEKELPATVGIDIGAESCRVLELTQAKGTFAILNWAIESYGKEGMEETLKKIADKFDFKSKLLATSVFGKGTLIRYITLPRMSLSDLKQSFSLEADKYFPFPKDQVYTDCTILDPKSREAKMSVLVVAVKKEIVDQHLQLLSGIGIQPDIVTLNPLAISKVFHTVENGSRFAKTSDRSENQAVAVLDIGDVVSNLQVLQNSLPCFTRDIYMGGREITKRISNIMSLSLSDAEKIKCQPVEQSTEVLAACESVLLSIIGECRLSFDYVITEKNVHINHMYLTGRSSMLNGLEAYFAKQMELPVEIWDPFKTFTFAPTISADEVHKNTTGLVVSLGLALNPYD